jgi:hypothetical protein
LIFDLLFVLTLILVFWRVVRNNRARLAEAKKPRNEEYTLPSLPRDNVCSAKTADGGVVSLTKRYPSLTIKRKRRVMGQVITNHPKMVRRWAVRYINMYRSNGPEMAKSWALEFLPAEPRQAMVDEVNRILKKEKGPTKGPA